MARSDEPLRVVAPWFDLDLWARKSSIHRRALDKWLQLSAEEQAIVSPGNLVDVWIGHCEYCGMLQIWTPKTRCHGCGN